MVLLSSCANNDKNQEPKYKPTQKKSNFSEVAAMPVHHKAFRKEIISNGKLLAINRADVPFVSNEIIDKIYLKNGSYVKRGQTIARLRNFVLQNKLEQNKIQFERSKVLLYDILIGQGYNYKTLAKIPKEVVDAAKIKSGYSLSQSELKLTEYEYKSSVITAPISGLIANLHHKVNNYAKNGEICCSIIRNDKFEVVFPVMESEVNFITKGDPVSIFPYFDEGLTGTGVITEINPSIDNNGLISIKAVISNIRNRLFEGMNVKVIIKIMEKSQLSVPKSAILLRDDRPVIFTVKDGKANWNYVITGPENNTSIVIKEGISEGDSVVYKGNLHLAHGTPVKIITSHIK